MRGVCGGDVVTEPVRRILKWDVPVDDQWHPIGSGPVVHVDCTHDSGLMQVWTNELGSPDTSPTQARVYGTGQPLPALTDQPFEVLGTALAAHGRLVWHVLRRWPS